MHRKHPLLHLRLSQYACFYRHVITDHRWRMYSCISTTRSESMFTVANVLNSFFAFHLAICGIRSTESATTVKIPKTVNGPLVLEALRWIARRNNLDVTLLFVKRTVHEPLKAICPWKFLGITKYLSALHRQHTTTFQLQRWGTRWRKSKSKWSPFRHDPRVLSEVFQNMYIYI